MLKTGIEAICLSLDLSTSTSTSDVYVYGYMNEAISTCQTISKVDWTNLQSSAFKTTLLKGRRNQVLVQVQVCNSAIFVALYPKTIQVY